MGFADALKQAAAKKSGPMSPARNLVMQIDDYEIKADDGNDYAIGRELGPDGVPADDAPQIRVCLRPDEKADERKFPRTEIAVLKKGGNKTVQPGGIVMFETAYPMKGSSLTYSASWITTLAHHAEEAFVRCRMANVRVLKPSDSRAGAFLVNQIHPEEASLVSSFAEAQQNLTAALHPVFTTEDGSESMTPGRPFAIFRVMLASGENVSFRILPALVDDGDGNKQTASGDVSLAKFLENNPDIAGLIQGAFAPENASEVRAIEVIPGQTFFAGSATRDNMLKSPEGRLEALADIYSPEGKDAYTETWIAVRYEENQGFFFMSEAKPTMTYDTVAYLEQDVPTPNFTPTPEMEIHRGKNNGANRGERNEAGNTTVPGLDEADAEALERELGQVAGNAPMAAPNF